MSAEQFRAAGYRLVDQIAALLDSIPARPVTRDESPSAVRDALDLHGSLPETGEDAGVLLESAARLIADHSLFNAHPRFFGYITAPPAPVGILGDFLASALNPNVGAWVLSPAASEVERQTVRWIAELIGYAPDCGGLLVSGGNMANLVCFFAARAAGADWDVREAGVNDGTRPRLCAYGSAETHTWIQKAADLSGIGTGAVRWIPTDGRQQMDLRALRDRVAADRADGHRPFIVVGTAGSVSTGAVDPLAAIAAFCRQERLWFHVDGAYGGFAAAAPGASSDLLALREADSVAVDPHKWLYAPLEAGCALVRDAEKLRQAFAYHPPYYHFDEQATNFVDFGMQNSRGFRALKVWLALRHAGAGGYRRMIAGDIALSRAMAGAVERQTDLELITQSLSITTFRYVPATLRGRREEAAVADYLNTLNRDLLGAIQRSGDAFVSNAVVDGRFVLRACIVNFHTTEADVDAVAEIAVRLGAGLDARLRPQSLASAVR
jgi:glutamate/tyrosine decarboxylase-like PLP-dependent enzyme